MPRPCCDGPQISVRRFNSWRRSHARKFCRKGSGRGQREMDVWESLWALSVLAGSTVQGEPFTHKSSRRRIRGAGPDPEPGGGTPSGRRTGWAGGNARQGHVGTHDGGSSGLQEAGTAAGTSVLGGGGPPMVEWVEGRGPRGRCSAAHPCTDETANTGAQRGAVTSGQPATTNQI